MLFMWYPNEKSDFKIADEETNIIPDGELKNVNEELKSSKRSYLAMRLEHPRSFTVNV